MAEIAPDPPGWLTALRFDIDTEGGGAAWIEAELPAPNFIVINPSNGHAHLIYLLGAWVQTDFGDSRRLKVVRYAAAIERAYSAALGADTAYAGRFHHNPLSCAYVTKIGREAPYSLDELARYVDLTAPPQKKSPPTGIGRNVEIFDRLRRWAYVAVVDWRIGTYDAWCGAPSCYRSLRRAVPTRVRAISTIDVILRADSTALRIDDFDAITHENAAQRRKCVRTHAHRPTIPRRSP